MLLGQLKQKMLLPKKDIFINKTVEVRGTPVYLIAITWEEHRNVLWVMHQLPCHPEEDGEFRERSEYTTNRDEMSRSIYKRMGSPSLYISEIVFQKQKMVFTSSSSKYMNTMDYEGCMQLQHFMENGMDTTGWEEAAVERMVITAYEQEAKGEFPAIDLSREPDITVKVGRAFGEVLINQPLSLEFGEIEKGRRFHFQDAFENKNRIFYIDGLVRYDLWGETKKKFEDEQLKALPEEQARQIKEQYMASIEKICPEGMDLALLEYETEDGAQLNFYAREYLDEKPVHETSMISMMFFSPEKEMGMNGFKSRMCMIKPVEKDFNGSIDIELFSWNMDLPEETITVHEA